MPGIAAAIISPVVTNGALVNPIPVGYEVLNDATPEPIKDSEGQTIYVLTT